MKDDEYVVDLEELDYDVRQKKIDHKQKVLKCEECGHPFKPGAEYCEECGAWIDYDLYTDDLELDDFDDLDNESDSDYDDVYDENGTYIIDNDEREEDEEEDEEEEDEYDEDAYWEKDE